MEHRTMTILGRQWRLCGLLIALVSLTLVNIASAQTTSTSVQKGATSTSTEVRRGEVVYVSGNELVVKMEDGQTKHFTIPESGRFSVDGRQLSVHELTPGMKLTQRITTTTVPQTITTVRSVSGTVWHVTAPTSVILTLPDGTNKQFKVPQGVKFTIDGQEKTVFDLRKGMKVTATAITQVPETLISRQTTVTGRAPAVAAAPPPEMPPAQEVGTLLVETTTPVKQPAQPDTIASAEPAPKKLPKTASPVPLLGLLGALAVMTGVGLRAGRKFLSY